MRIEYVSKSFSPAHRSIIARANAILTEYADAGYDMTLRQVYYQFVARGFIENTIQSYKRLGDILNSARLAGLIDWDLMVDRTRSIESFSAWDSPAAIVRAVAQQYARDLWKNQPVHVEVWVEKEALIGVVEQAARRWRAPYLACRGNVSQSTMFEAAQNFSRYIDAGQRVVVLHLGDHDPNGIDMSRDMDDRLQRMIVQNHHDSVEGVGMDIVNGDEFLTDSMWESMSQALTDPGDSEGCEDINPSLYGVFELRRIALNMDQVRRLNPPPNPVKLTDSRAQGYIQRFGRESWELDALDPAALTALVDDEMSTLIDPTIRDADEAQMETERQRLQAISDHMPEVADFLDGLDD